MGLDDGTTAAAATAVVVAVVVGLVGLTKGTSRREISLRGEDAVFAESAVVFEDLPFEDGLLLFDVLFSISNLVLTNLRPKDATFGLSEASLDIFIKLLVLLTVFCGCEPILFTVAVVVVVVIAVNAVADDDGMDGCLSGLGLTVFIEDGLIAAAVVVGLFVV